jgi:hypothetical protein
MHCASCGKLQDSLPRGNWYGDDWIEWRSNAVATSALSERARRCAVTKWESCATAIRRSGVVRHAQAPDISPDYYSGVAHGCVLPRWRTTTSPRSTPQRDNEFSFALNTCQLCEFRLNLRPCFRFPFGCIGDIGMPEELQQFGAQCGRCATEVLFRQHIE